MPKTRKTAGKTCTNSCRSAVAVLNLARDHNGMTPTVTAWHFRKKIQARVARNRHPPDVVGHDANRRGLHRQRRNQANHNPGRLIGFRAAGEADLDPGEDPLKFTFPVDQLPIRTGQPPIKIAAVSCHRATRFSCEPPP